MCCECVVNEAIAVTPQKSLRLDIDIGVVSENSDDSISDQFSLLIQKIIDTTKKDKNSQIKMMSYTR